MTCYIAEFISSVESPIRGLKQSLKSYSFSSPLVWCDAIAMKFSISLISVSLYWKQNSLWRMFEILPFQSVVLFCLSACTFTHAHTVAVIFFCLFCFGFLFCTSISQENGRHRAVPVNVPALSTPALSQWCVPTSPSWMQQSWSEHGHQRVAGLIWFFSVTLTKKNSCFT